MNKVIVLSALTQVYSIPADQTAEQVAAASGVTDPALYQEFAESDFDAACYNYTSAFTLVGGIVGFDLPTAQTNAVTTLKAQASTETQTVSDGYSPTTIAGQVALAVVDRDPAIAAVIAATNDITANLSESIAAVNAATTIDEVNNIVNPPTGILSTGRGSAGPLDLNVSEYTAFNSASMTEAETELFVPGTSTVINYGEFVPNKFDSAGNCFTLGDYLVQIREVATGMVIAEFECPLAPANEDVAF